MGRGADMTKTFFISYNSADKAWAHWIGWTVKSLGFDPRVHEWEIAGGENVPAWMESALGSADGMLALVSPQFLTAKYSQAEVHAGTWRSFQNQDGFVKPIVVTPVQDWPIFLGCLKRVSLVGLARDEAIRELADFLKTPSAPAQEPPYPGVTVQARPLERYRADKSHFMAKYAHRPVAEMGSFGDDPSEVPPVVPDATRDVGGGDHAAATTDPLIEAFLRVTEDDRPSEEDEGLGKALNDAGLALTREGQVAQALERFEAAEFLLRRVFGEGANSVAQVKSNMADTLLLNDARSDLLRALELSREAVALQEARFGPNPEQAAVSRTKVARVLLRLGAPGDLEEAMRILKEADRATQSDETRRDIQGIKARILKRHRSRSDLATAYMIEKKLLAAAQSDDERATAANNLAHTLWALEDRAEAEAQLQAAKGLYAKCYGPGHAFVQEAEASLQALRAGQTSVYAP